ncbi:MAG TPA: hypothetical protein DCL35_05930 [Candidatus Omnitrophica bacterium]|nr:hypothetical protein [Candidatus Omnitrophota bacterium]
MRKTALLLCLLFLYSGGLSAYADKFGGTFSTDYMTQDTKQNSKSITMQATSIPKTPVVQEVTTTTIPAAPLETTVTSPAVFIPQSPQVGAAMPIPLPTTSDIKQIKITVPDYEKKLQAMMQAKEAQALKKKKSLIDSILEEITRYGMVIVLLLVILVIFYALRKDKTTAPPQEPAKPEAIEPAKKTIWDDEF